MTTADPGVAGSCLSLQGVEKHFAPRRSLLEIAHIRTPERLEVIDGVDLQVEAGAIVCLMGPNGSGKTTLLRLAAGVLLPDAGRVSVLGRDPAASAPARYSIGFLSSSERSFYWRLTAGRNLRFWGSLQGLHGRRLDRAVEEAASLAECREVLDRRFENISTGMRQRVGLARAVLHGPSLLLLDEPTRSMDAEAAESFYTVIRRLAGRGTAVLMSTHSASEAARLGRRTVRIEDGALREVHPDRIGGVELAIDFEGEAEAPPPAGMSLSRGRLLCPSDRLAAAVSWLEDAGLRILGVAGAKGTDDGS
ncbi:MAG: ABC transporter ATP-binding protein [Candidatus Fermentibacteraceae bacterium]